MSVTNDEYWLWQAECAWKQALIRDRKRIKREREVSPELRAAIECCREKWSVEPIESDHA